MAALRTALLACALVLLPAGTARADALLPPAGQRFAGVTAGDPGTFQAETGVHAPVVQHFVAWGSEGIDHVFRSAEGNRSRLMIHVSTQDGPGTREVITPRGIARGQGDRYLLFLNRRFAAAGRPGYIRLMSEMNGHWNAYSAFDASGRRRDAAHATRAFRQAWRRTVLVVRGGPVAALNRRLRRLGLPPLRTGAAKLPRPPVAFLWVPQTAGSPNLAGNRPGAYWPGGAYVDWTGTDFYSRFPNFAGLDRFVARGPWRRKPFAFGEWALWGADDPGFVRRLFRWIGRHPRVRLVMYNQGSRPSGPFRLTRYPRATAELRRQLARPAFAPFAPEWRPGG